MSTSNGHRHRLRRLEDGQQPPPVDADNEEAERYAKAHHAALMEILNTMAEVHLVGITEDMRAHREVKRSTAWGRLRGEIDTRIGLKIGHYAGAPPRYPDSPLALPPAVAEAVLDDIAGKCEWLPHGLRCYACGYLLPTTFEWIAIERDQDGRWHDRATGIPCAAPPVPSDPNDRYRTRLIVLFTACPLCGYSDLVSTVNDRTPEKVWA